MLLYTCVSTNDTSCAFYPNLNPKQFLIETFIDIYQDLHKDFTKTFIKTFSRPS
jgi:hypothetical protein